MAADRSVPLLRLLIPTTAAIVVLAFSTSARVGAAAEKRKFVPTAEYESGTVEGWTVRVNRRLRNENAETGSRALLLLEKKLQEIKKTVPAPAVARLQQVPLWLGVDDGSAPCAEYHPSRQWLMENGYNPEKAKCVEIGNAGRFLEWSPSQPAMILHELAHAYHDQILGFNHAGVKEAFQAAVTSKSYEAVRRNNGKTERHYALTNEREYFAEATEAYFGTNDFYPFTRSELQKHDPGIARLLAELWTPPR